MLVTGIIEIKGSDIKSYYFDSRISIKVEKKDNLINIDFENNEKYVKHFYSNNIECLTVNVGANGSGKTRLIRKIIDVFEGEKLKENTILIFKYKNNYYYKLSDIFIYEVSFINKEFLKDNGEWRKSIRQTKVIFLSNNLESSKLILNRKYKYVNDVSITNKLVNKIPNYLALEQSSADNQIRFVFNDISDELIGGVTERFNLSSIIELEPEKIDNDYDHYFNQHSFIYNCLKKESEELISENKYKKFQVTMTKQFLYNQIKNSDNISFNFRDELAKKFGSLRTDNAPDYNMTKIVEEINLFLSNNEMFRKIFFVESFNENILVYKDFLKNLKINLKEDDTYLIDISDFMTQDKKLLEYNKLMLSENIFNYFSKSWNSISSGTNSLLSIFSYLSTFSDTEEEEDIIILLDEVDVTLHPEWQRRFINELLMFLNRRYINKQIQLILTTHSPLVLSDIRKDDVNFLSENNSEIEIYTFGANLNELMAESFFLSDGLMGDFSKGVIETIISKINSDVRLTQIEVNQIFIIIEEIGEVFIKSSLIKNMESSGYYKVNSNSTDRRKYLENELKKINEELKELNRNSGEVR